MSGFRIKLNGQNTFRSTSTKDEAKETRRRRGSLFLQSVQKLNCTAAAAATRVANDRDFFTYDDNNDNHGNVGAEGESDVADSNYFPVRFEAAFSRAIAAPLYVPPQQCSASLYSQQTTRRCVDNGDDAPKPPQRRYTPAPPLTDDANGGLGGCHPARLSAPHSGELVPRRISGESPTAWMDAHPRPVRDVDPTGWMLTYPKAHPQVWSTAVPVAADDDPPFDDRQFTYSPVNECKEGLVIEIPRRKRGTPKGKRPVRPERGEASHSDWNDTAATEIALSSRPPEDDFDAPAPVFSFERKNAFQLCNTEGESSAAPGPVDGSAVRRDLSHHPSPIDAVARLLSNRNAAPAKPRSAALERPGETPPTPTRSREVGPPPPPSVFRTSATSPKHRAIAGDGTDGRPSKTCFFMPSLTRTCKPAIDVKTLHAADLLLLSTPFPLLSVASGVTTQTATTHATASTARSRTSSTKTTQERLDRFDRPALSAPAAARSPLQGPYQDLYTTRFAD